MDLKINVTWPPSLLPSLPLCISVDCSDVSIISRSKATRSCDRITINDAFGERNRVCDDDRYRITQQSSSPLECCQRSESFERTLVIILESPHKSEYQIGCIDRPIGPAQDTTGRNIRDYLMGVVRSCHHIHDRIGNRPTRVILANPIQFQTSLAAMIQVNKWRKIRNAVWKALWDRPEIKDEFKVRLNCYNPNFIINACTSNFRKRIRDFLDEHFPCAHIYTTKAHPSSWNQEVYQTLSLARPTLSANPPLSAANINCTTLTVTLPSGTTFTSDADASSFVLFTTPDNAGLSIRNVAAGASGGTSATLTLATASGCGFSTPVTLSVRVLSAAYSGRRDLTFDPIEVSSGGSG